MMDYFDPESAPSLIVRHRAEPLRGQWAAAATISLLAVTILCFAALICADFLRSDRNVTFQSRSRIGGFANPQFARLKREEEERQATKQRVAMVTQGIAAGTLFMCLVSACCFLRWLRYAQRNLTNLKAAGVSDRSGFFVLACVIPGVNLFMPYNIVQETWKASDPLATENHHAWRDVPSALFIWSWWIFSLTACLHFCILFWMMYSSSNVEMMIDSRIAGSAFAIAALGLLIAVILSITRRQRKRRIYLFAYTS